MEINASGTSYDKHKHLKGEQCKKGSQMQAGKSQQYYEVERETVDEKEYTKQSKFPSLSKLGRSHTFSFGRKKEKENEKKGSGKASKASEKNMEKKIDESTRKKSQESNRYEEKSKSYEERHMDTYGKSRKSEERYKAVCDHGKTSSNFRHQELIRSRSCDGRTVSRGKENRTREYSTSSGKYVTGKESKASRRRDCKRKEVPIDRAFDHNSIPLWLRNPPKILIQDFSSDYVDETTFDEEYFDLVQWAFRILQQQCIYRMHSPYVDFELEDDEPTLLGASHNEPLEVITAETARVGSTLDYILHPISTGAANMLQTGAKLADFTSRVFRGINFESIIRKRNEHESSSSKK